MKWMALTVALAAGAMLLPGAPAQAAGCLKGAVVGGVAGHYIVHHGWLGAAAGCLIGRHEANRAARTQHRTNHEHDAGYRQSY